MTMPRKCWKPSDWMSCRSVAAVTGSRSGLKSAWNAGCRSWPRSRWRWTCPRWKGSSSPPGRGNWHSFRCLRCVTTRRWPRCGGQCAAERSASRPRCVLVLLQCAAYKLRLGGLGRVMRTTHRQQVAGAELVHNALHLAAGPLVRPDIPFQRLDAAAGAEQGNEVSASRPADDPDVLQVEIVLLGVGPDPADRGLAIVDLGRPDRLPAEPVVDRDRGIVPAGDTRGDLAHAHFLVAHPEGSAVNVHDHRQRLVALRCLRQVHVQSLARIFRGGIGNVLLDLDGLRYLEAPARTTRTIAEESIVFLAGDETMPVGVNLVEPVANELGHLVAAQLAVLVRIKPVKRIAAFRGLCVNGAGTQESEG